MNKQNERHNNLLRIIDVLRTRKVTTQAELKEICSLQASTVSYLINDLRTFNFIKDSGKASCSGRKVGKPGLAISLNNEAACFLGIYLIDNAVELFVYGLDGEELDESRICFEADKLIETLYKGIDEKLSAYPQIKKIAIAVKGIIHNDGHLESGVRHTDSGAEDHWDIANFVEKIRQRYPEYEIIVENDANCAAIYYYTKNKDKYENVTTVTYVLNDQPFGIGLGLIIEGKLFRGSDGCAGEYYEKDSFLKESKYSVRDNLVPVVEKLLNHMKMTAYLLNPVKLIICGNAFSSAGEDTLRQLEGILSSLPCAAELKCEPHFSAPACGAALIGADSYVREIIGGIEKRWS